MPPAAISIWSARRPAFTTSISIRHTTRTATTTRSLTARTRRRRIGCRWPSAPANGFLDAGVLMLQAIFFDFDGVIADSEPLHLRAYQSVLQRDGIDLTRD